MVETDYYKLSSIVYIPEQIIFMCICLILSVYFPHSVESVKQRDEQNQTNKAKKGKKGKKIEEKMENQRISSMRKNIFGDKYKD